MNTFTDAELFDIRLALSDCKMKWYGIWQESLQGKGYSSPTGSRLVWEEYSKLHEKLIRMTDK